MEYSNKEVVPESFKERYGYEVIANPVSLERTIIEKNHNRQP
jgi:hypothetical protein